MINDGWVSADLEGGSSGLWQNRNVDAWIGKTDKINSELSSLWDVLYGRGQLLIQQLIRVNMQGVSKTPWIMPPGCLLFPHALSAEFILSTSSLFLLDRLSGYVTTDGIFLSQLQLDDRNQFIVKMN